MAEAFICDAIRTPFGRYGGALASVRADDLGAMPLRALMERNPSVDWGAVDDVVYGCANQAGEDNRNVGRMALLLAGLPAGSAGHDGQPAVRIEHGRDRASPRARSRRGETSLMIAGGVESMSRAPFVHGQGRRGVLARGEDRGHDDRLALRQSADEGAATASTRCPRRRRTSRSEFNVSPRRPGRVRAAQPAARRRRDRGRTPGRGDRPGDACRRRRAIRSSVATDEHPRATTLESLAKLKGVVRPDGTVTAGNASGVNDGACATDPRIRGSRRAGTG